MRAQTRGGIWLLAALLAATSCSADHSDTIGRAKAPLPQSGGGPDDEGLGDDGDTSSSQCTRTQLDWGEDHAQPGNAATLREQQFSRLYPRGLTVGCETGFTLTLTSSDAVAALLPAAGTPAALDASLTDPQETKAGSLAGEVVALQLNVDLAAAGAFGGGAIDALSVSDEACGGRTVGEVLAAARAVLGGCPGALSAAQLAACAARINEGAAIQCEDVCPDHDLDGVCDAEDDCPDVANADQQDANGDGVGDACER